MECEKYQGRGRESSREEGKGRENREEGRLGEIRKERERNRQKVSDKEEEGLRVEGVHTHSVHYFKLLTPQGGAVQI